MSYIQSYVPKRVSAFFGSQKKCPFVNRHLPLGRVKNRVPREKQLGLFSPRPLPLVTLFLLPRHDLPHGQLVVHDQLAADIQFDLVEFAGERERRLIIGRDGRAHIGADSQAAAQAVRHGSRDGHFDLAHQLLVDIELGPAGRSFALADIGLARRLELEPQLVAAGRHVVLGPDDHNFLANVVMDVAQLPFLDVEGVSPVDAPHRKQHALGPFLGDLHIGSDAVRPVQRAGRPDIGCVFG